ncbi:MAG TPA: DUF6502 family protein [Burkholderiaceae bacterium]|nr:DUF6502 family protein [Burkholderiaceae bacterium]
MSIPETPPAGAPAAAIDALLAVLRPLARLAIDHGVQFGQLQELTKQAMVEAALRATEAESGRGDPPVSRLSVMTGIHRKEVKRLAESPDLDAVRAEPAPAAELFTRWVSDPTWRDADGRPKALSRRPGGDGVPSFEALSRSVTTDVHPRTLLDELLRLQLVAVDPDTDEVRLLRDAFVPSGRIEDLLAFVGANVGDHLAAARDNVAASLRAALAHDPDVRAPFVEQALYADGLSAESATVAAERARLFWTELLRQMAPELQRLEDDDRIAGRPAARRVRIGLYCYAEPLPPIDDSDDPSGSPAR